MSKKGLSFMAISSTQAFPEVSKRNGLALGAFYCVPVCVSLGYKWEEDGHLMGHQGIPEAVGGACHWSPDRFDPKTHQSSLSMRWVENRKYPSGWKQGLCGMFSRGPEFGKKKVTESFWRSQDDTAGVQGWGLPLKHVACREMANLLLWNKRGWHHS